MIKCCDSATHVLLQYHIMKGALQSANPGVIVVSSLPEMIPKKHQPCGRKHHKTQMIHNLNAEGTPNTLQPECYNIFMCTFSLSRICFSLQTFT